MKGLSFRADLWLVEFMRWETCAEPKAPKMLTEEFPGPKSRAALASLGKNNTDSTWAAQAVVDQQKSKHNYFVDLDGNTILDFHCHLTGSPLGYNSDILRYVSFGTISPSPN